MVVEGAWVSGVGMIERFWFDSGRKCVFCCVESTYACVREDAVSI